MLDRVTLVLAPGRVTVLVGPSGVGKTVCVKLLTGLIEPTRGRVLADGHDIASLSAEELGELRRRMSVMLQGATLFGAALFGSSSVYENIAYPLRVRSRLSGEEVEQRVGRQLDALGLRSHVSQLPAELSAGTRRRVALARALVSGSEILLLDDIDSGLDAGWLRGVRDAIRDAQRASGATVLLTTHEPRLALELADVLAVLRSGRIVACGPPDEVLGDTAAFPALFLTGDGDSGLRMGDELEGAPLRADERLRLGELASGERAEAAGLTAVAALLYVLIGLAVLGAVSVLLFALFGPNGL